MNSAISQPVLVDRGPSWSAQASLDPVWVTRLTLSPRLAIEEHVVERYQYSIHLGNSLPVETVSDGHRLVQVAQYGDLTWTPAGHSCRASWRQPRELGFVTLSRPFVHETLEHAGANALPEGSNTGNGDALTRHLVLALISHDWSDRIYLESLATSLLMHLLRSAGRLKEHQKERAGQGERAGRLGRQQLQRAIEYSESRLGDRFDLRSWAREVALSPYHFARLFKQATGLAPHQFVMRRRVEQARQSLAGSEAPLSAVAYDLGFANQSHFGRVFRKHTGMTPRQWRDMFGPPNRDSDSASDIV